MKYFPIYITVKMKYGTEVHLKSVHISRQLISMSQISILVHTTDQTDRTIP